MAEPIQQQIDPFVSASGNVDEGKKKMLEAAATAGTAGLKAYDAAQKEQAAAQQAALQRALERERLIGAGPLGTQAPVADTFGRYSSALSGSRAGFEAGIEGAKQSGINYMEKLRAAGPLLSEINKGKVDARDKEIQSALALAQAEAEAKAQAEEAKEARRLQEQLDRENRAEQRAIEREGRTEARRQADRAADNAEKFPMKEIIGATNIAVDAAKGQLPTIKKDLDNENRLIDRETKRLASVEGTLTKLFAKMQTAGWQGEYRMGGKEAIKVKADFDRLQKEQAILKPRLQTRAQKAANLQAQFESVNQAANNPTALSRMIATEQFGRDPNEAHGYLTDSTWAPILNAVATNDGRPISEQAKKLASKTGIQGGAAKAQEILADPVVKRYIKDTMALEPGSTTWADAKKQLALDFLQPANKDRVFADGSPMPKIGVPQQRTYALLIELLRDLPWKAK